MIALLNISVLGFSFVAFHDKAKRTQQGNLSGAWWNPLGGYNFIYFYSVVGAWCICYLTFSSSRRYILIYFHPFLGRGGFIQLSGRQPPSQLGGTCPTQCQTLETHIVHNVETFETQHCCKQTLLSRQIAKHLTHNNTPLLQTHII